MAKEKLLNPVELQQFRLYSGDNIAADKIATDIVDNLIINKSDGSSKIKNEHKDLLRLELINALSKHIHAASQ